MGSIQTIKIPLSFINLSLKQYYQKRNEILIIRRFGGLGDILMTRMLFEDIKKMIPDCRTVYALPKKYHDAVKNHPFIDEIVDCQTVNPSSYNISYDISTACGNYEQAVAPMSDKHRSDIWAEHCGFTLNNHNMHLTVDEEFKEFGRKEIKKYYNNEKGTVLLCPVSAMQGKNLDSEQMNGVAKGLQKAGYLVLGLHSKSIDQLIVPTLHNYSILQWLGIIDAADYIVTVDTASFHAGGGLGKPMVAIFSWADGKVYGKWYKNFQLVQKHRDNGNWSCGPCYNWTVCSKCPNNKITPRKPCITEITPEEIIIAFKNLSSVEENGISS